MKGVVYSTRNGQGSTTLEVWFEDIGICVNQNNEIFRHNGPRKAMNHFGTMDFPAAFCESVKKYVELRENVEESNGKLFTVLKKKLMSHKGKHFTVEK